MWLRRRLLVPPDGGWSAGAIAEHLLLVEIAIARLLGTASVPCDRDPEKKVAWIRKQTLNRAQRIDAPPSLLPSDAPKDPDAFCGKIAAQRRELLQVISRQDLYRLYTEKHHRIYGPLTGIEWVSFLVYHCMRHIAQLEALGGFGLPAPVDVTFGHLVDMLHRQLTQLARPHPPPADEEAGPTTA